MSIEKLVRVNNDLFHHFQPIFHLQENKAIGYEALLRSKTYSQPAEIFQKAFMTNSLYEIDMYSFYHAIKSYMQVDFIHEGKDLYINLYPSTLSHQDFVKDMEWIFKDLQFSSLQQHLVLEMIESEFITDYTVLRNVIHRLHQKRIRVAIDDFGKGEASLKLLVELDVDYIKIDRYFAEDLLHNNRKQQILTFLLSFEQQEFIILEGIETVDQLTAAQTLKIPFGQGYFFGKPSAL